MKNYNGKLCKNAGKLRPIARVQVTFKYELKAQIPASNVKLPPLQLPFPVSSLPHS